MDTGQTVLNVQTTTSTWQESAGLLSVQCWLWEWVLRSAEIGQGMGYFRRRRREGFIVKTHGRRLVNQIKHRQYEEGTGDPD